MLVGVPKEIKDHEYRVGLVPSTVRELTAKGHQVLVETNAGIGAGLPDSDYIAAGAKIAPGPDPYSTLVYAARGSDVRTTVVDGEILVDDFLPLRVDWREIAAEARAAAGKLAARASV